MHRYQISSAFVKRLAVAAPVTICFLVLSCWPAGAQTPPMQPCNVSTGVPPLIRAEGLAELIGDIIVSCYQPLPPIVDVKLTLNANATNRANYPHVGFADAVLLWDSWYQPLPIAPAFATLLPDSQSLLWPAVSMLPPGSNPSMRITNVRAAVHGLPVAGMGAPAQVTAFVSISAGGQLLFASGPMTVAFAVPAIRADIRPPLATESFRVYMQENFATAWKVLGSPVQMPVYESNQEDGYYTPGSGKNDGGATQGTRIIVRFLDTAGGAQILVPNLLQSAQGTYPGPTVLQRVFNADVSGAGGCYDFSCLPAPPATHLSEATPSGRDAFVVYEVISSVPFVTESVEFPVYLCQGNGKAGGCHVMSGTIKQKDLQVRVSLAPVSNVNLADTMSPRPRFVEVGPLLDLLRWPR